MKRFKQRALTLLELIVYLGIFALFLNSIFFTFKGCRKLMDMTVKQTLLVHQLQTVKNALQRDIRTAGSIGESIGHFNADDHTLILTLPNAKQALAEILDENSAAGRNDSIGRAAAGHIVYRFANGRLDKWVFVDDSELEEIGSKGFRTEFHDMQFLYDRASGKSGVVTVRISTKSKRLEHRCVLAFSTAMRNFKK